MTRSLLGNGSEVRVRQRGGQMVELQHTAWTAPVRNLVWVAAHFGHR